MVFSELISTYDKEYDIAISVIDALQSAKDQLDRWAFTVYFFNLANEPSLIETAVELEVKDGRVRFLLPCRLLTVTDTEYTEKNELIVVGPNSSALFGLMTLQSQTDMGIEGSALARIYQAGHGTCRALSDTNGSSFKSHYYHKWLYAIHQTERPQVVILD